jgi:hypothetical protein
VPVILPIADERFKATCHQVFGLSVMSKRLARFIFCGPFYSSGLLFVTISRLFEVGKQRRQGLEHDSFEPVHLESVTVM